MKKKNVLLGMMSVACLTIGLLTGCGQKEAKESLTVFNYGMYMDPDMITQFTKETGIEIKYEEAPTPEELYTKYIAGAIDYDVLCTTDYMLQRLINEGEAVPIDRTAMENTKNINDRYWKFSQVFDPENKYTVPYFWGTVGILYDTTKVNEPIDSWEVLFNGEYAGDIIMQNSMRDSYMLALKYLGYSLNSDNKAEIQEAQDLLLKQKPDVSAYLVDEVRDEVVAGNATMGVIYSSEAYLGHQYNEDLAYVIPKEGSNVWMDGWCVTKKCKNVENAQKFLDFLCREDVAMKNFEYVGCSTPNDAVVANFTEEQLADEALVPTDEAIANCEVCVQASDETTELLNTLWKELKAE